MLSLLNKYFFMRGSLRNIGLTSDISAILFINFTCVEGKAEGLQIKPTERITTNEHCNSKVKDLGFAEGRH